MGALIATQRESLPGVSPTGSKEAFQSSRSVKSAQLDHAGTRLATYAGATDRTPVHTALDEIIRRIRGDQALANAVAVIRGEPDKDRRDQLKKQLPAVQVSAKRAEAGRRVLEHSGFIQIDIDGKDHHGVDLDELREKLEADPHLVSVFASPSGGVKAFMAIPANLGTHGASFAAVDRYMAETYGAKIDPATKDATRLCFLSADPQATYKPEAAPLDIEAWAPRPKAATPPGMMLLPSEQTGNLESAESIFSTLARSNRIFVRGGRVVQLVKASNAFALDPVDPDQFRTLIETHGRLYARRVGPHGEPLLKADARCSTDNAKMFLASPAKDKLPPVDSIHNCPLLVQGDDSAPIVLPGGYHRHGGGKLITNGETPMAMTLPDAVDCLLETLVEFSFATPADKSRAVAAIITPALINGLIGSHVPLFVVEADDSQAGKGYLLELSQRIYRETPSLVGQRSGGVGGFDESLSQAMLTGRKFIQFDNLRGGINSSFLEMVLTCPLNGTVSARVPHKGEMAVDPSKFIFQLSSNGFESTTDLANRSCIIRIKKRRGHSFKEYPEGGLLDHVTANQPRFLGSVYSIVSQWIVEGKLRTRDTRGEGRFREWAQALDWIVTELCGLPPLMDGHQQAQVRAANPALTWLRQLAIAISGLAALGQEFSASQLVEMSEEAGLTIPGMKTDADDKQKAQKVGIIMGNLFKESESIGVDAFTVERVIREQFMESSGQTKEAKKYTFTNQANQANQTT